MPLPKNDEFEQKPLSTQIAKGATALGFWNLFNKIPDLLNSLLVIYLLSVYEYGVYRLVLSIISVSQIALFDSLNGIVLNDAARELGEKNKSRASRIFFEYSLVKISLGFIAWLVLFFGATFVGSNYFSPSIVRFLQISSFLIIFYVFGSLLDIFLRINLKFSLLGKFSVMIESLKLVILSFLFFFLHSRNIETVLISTLLSYGAVTLIYFKIISPDLRDWLRSLSESSEFLFSKIIKTYGRWAVLTGFLSNFHSNMKIWLIKFFLGTEAVAIYSVAEGFVNYLLFIPLSDVLSVFIPRVITDGQKMRNLFLRGVKYITFLSLSLAVLGLVFIPILTKLIIPKYSSSLPIFTLLLLAFTFIGWREMSGRIIFALRDQKFIFYQMVLKIPLLLGLNIILLPAIGVSGAAISEVSVSFVLLLHRIARLRKICGDIIPLKLRDYFAIDGYDRALFWKFLKKIPNISKNI